MFYQGSHNISYQLICYESTSRMLGILLNMLLQTKEETKKNQLCFQLFYQNNRLVWSQNLHDFFSRHIFHNFEAQFIPKYFVYRLNAFFYFGIRTF